MYYNFDEEIDRLNTSSIKYDGLQQFFGSDDLLPMWVADMDFRTPHFIINALKNRLEHEVLGYSFRSDSFQEAVAGWLKRRHGWEIKKEWIVFTPGVVPGVNLAVLAHTSSGDNIITQPPVYFPFFNAVTDHVRKLVYNKLSLINGRLSVDFDNLENECRKGAKMIIISSPHNPGGNVWTRDELSKIAAICLRYNVLIVSDEIHCDLVYKPNKHTPMASLSDEIASNTITFIAPSKTFNVSGLSSSLAIIPDENLRKQFVSTLDHLHIGLGNIFGNVAMEAAFTYGDEYDDALMEYLAGNVALVESFLETNLPQIKPVRPEATFLVWLDCREMGMTDKELNDFFLKKARLALNQGIQFGPGGEGFMRLNIGCTKATLLKGLNRLKQAFSTL
ncbi:MAG TPA: PatB family C-S lyase [Bacteroidales bacterium]|jgi:cystathionine beta-lyase|nr:PatB family C-S lyase [Bacteroidales bacterium]